MLFMKSVDEVKCETHGLGFLISGDSTNPYLQGWGENDRGVSFTFGADVVSKFLNRHDLDLICRAHQVISCPSTLLYPVSLMIEG